MGEPSSSIAQQLKKMKILAHLLIAGIVLSFE
jgi:hypothetical protein